MTGSSKILTVSYGTFSCTLEGFDDPLAAMREMAEYFRDLAADDRYFGAEPPSPDVDMLQRIAEKEVQRRVEARVSDSGVALVATGPEEATEPVSEDQKKSSPDRGNETLTAFDAAELPAPVVSTGGPLTYSDDFVMSDEPEDVLEVDPAAEFDADSSGPAETVAEKLRRIRAVVSRERDTEALHEEQSPNAQHPDLRDRAVTKTIKQIQDDLGLAEGDEDTLADVEPTEAVKADEPELAQPVEPEAVEIDGAAEDSDDAEEDFDPETDETEATVEATETVAGHGEVSDTSESTENGDELAIEDGDEGLDAEPELGPETGAQDALLDDAFSEDEFADEDDADSVAVSGVLRKLSKDIASLDETPEPAAPIAAQDRVTTRMLAPEPEVDVGRLLDEADTKLNDNDTIRRRRVISQMRAAVAATKAERMVTRQLSQRTVEEAERTPYRADLSEVVQDPAPGQKTARKSSAPPLVLVSSQRVSDDEDEARRSKSLADFHAKNDANELSELMEAAAAFAIFTEGQDSFTRPEIMTLVARMDPSLQMSREDSLRSFGQLLRQGTFRKLERGQFTIDETTRFNPQQRVSEA